MSSETAKWSYLLDELCQVRGISHALAVSSDGLVMAASTKLPKDQADQTAAIISGLSSLAHGACRYMDAGAVESTIVDMTHGYMVTMVINDRALLTVLAAKNGELGQIVYEMGRLINQAGETFVPPQRDPQWA